MKELTARSVTSPRLRGEVEIRAPAREFRVRGKRLCAYASLCSIARRPLTPTLSPQAGRGRNAAALIHPLCPTRDCATRDLSQLVEQRLRLFQVGGIEALGEPAENGCEEVARPGRPALFAPKPGKAHRSAQLPRFRLLLPGGFERSAEAHLRSLLVRGIEAQPQLRVQPMQLWFIVHDAG